AAKIALPRHSMLDAGRGDAKRLESRIGAADRQKLNAHLDTLRSIEMRLDAPSACVAPKMPAADATIDYDHEDLEGLHTTMADILTVALACDLTRNFKLSFTGMQTDTVFWQVGANRGLHTITHENTTESQLLHHKAIVF